MWGAWPILEARHCAHRPRTAPPCSPLGEGETGAHSSCSHGCSWGCGWVRISRPVADGTQAQRGCVTCMGPHEGVRFQVPCSSAHPTESPASPALSGRGPLHLALLTLTCRPQTAPCAQGPTRARQGWGRWPACLSQCFLGLLPLAPVSGGAGLCRVGSGSQEGPLGLLRPTCAPRTAAGPKRTTKLPSANSPPRHQTPLPAFIADMGRPGGWKTARRGKPQPQHCSCWGHGKQC